ncbi:MAG TPA: hypothetical protein DCL81_04320, partial [Algoriphagus sp.]|nr:hypothetical protein [Algoriphagus sp.]
IKPEDLDEIDDWLESEEGSTLMNLIYKNYHLKRAQINASPQVHVFESPYANGFAVTYDSPLTQKSFSNLFLA